MSDAAAAEYRALEVFDHVPPGCRGVFVGSDCFAPHLRKGEFAIVDTTDMSPTRGEIYVRRYNTGRGPIWQFAQIVRGFAGDTSGIWCGFCLKVPGRMRYVDGPMPESYWPEGCMGRVIGVLEPVAAVTV